MAAYNHLMYDVEDGIVEIRFDRPEKMNALSPSILEDLPAAIERAERSSDTRVIILTGEGEAFSAGYDFSDEAPGGVSEGTPRAEETFERADMVIDFVRSVIESDLPVIAAVNGYAIAGGCDLALASDLTIASERAEFGYSAVRIGGFPTLLLEPYVVGSIKYAKELLYTGKRVDAHEAERFGMVNRTVYHEDLMEEVYAEAREILKVPRTSVTMAKRVLENVVEAQGRRFTENMGPFVLAYGHQTEQGKRFFEIRDEEGMKAAVEWMNEAEKP